MNPPLRVLHLEDSPDDAILVRRKLRVEFPRCEVIRVDEEAAFRAAIKTGSVDLILSDYRVPSFHGMTALALTREICPEVPFLFLSGMLGDELAVDCLKAGATDYLLKDRPARLVPAIRRALAEADVVAKRKQMEAQLRYTEDQYRDLFESATDLIQIVGTDGRFMLVNPAWLKTLGYTQAEVRSLSFLDVLHCDYHEQWRRRLQCADTGDPSSAWEAILLTKQRHPISVQGNMTVRRQEGKAIAFRGTFHDVTQKKLAELALEHSIREYEALVNSIDGIVWQATFPDLRFTFVSRQAERLLGHSPRSWLEHPDFWRDHIHPDDRERAIALCRELTPDRKYQSFEYRMLAADGRFVWLRDLISMRADDPVRPQLQGIMVDITAAKLAEETMACIQAELQKTNRDLLKKNREIENFYHTLSHELKTPLTSASEFVSIVIDGLAGSINDTQREYLEIAKDSCIQLRNCINDLFDATRLETGKLALQRKPVRLDLLARRVITAMLPTAREKEVSLTEDLQPGLAPALADEHRIIQVITNLLANALKHTGSGGSIHIRLRPSALSDDLLEFSVRDTGCGISPADQQHIFDRLYQVKTGDATTGGVGLGLYLSRELVQLHGGQIWVESQLGQGSAFTFVIPKAPSEEPAADSSLSRGAPASKPQNAPVRHPKHKPTAKHPA
jgi:PAS domain S-box-containing protein